MRSGKCRWRCDHSNAGYFSLPTPLLYSYADKEGGFLTTQSIRIVARPASLCYQPVKR